MNLEQQRNVAWIIKHRPKSVSEVVGKEARQIEKFLDSGNLPHLLLISRVPGTGKTTIAKALINDTGAHYLEINSSDERGIDTIRDKIKHFVSTMSSKPGVKKIVFLDEMDSMTKIAQEALRNMIETFAHNAVFILTANYFEKIIDPIKNRCEVIQFGNSSKEDIYKYLENICQEESVTFDSEGLNKLIDIKYPSIRAMVGELQRFKTLNIEITTQSVKKDDEKFMSLWIRLKNKKVLDVRKEVLEQGYNEDELLKFFFRQTYEDSSLSNVQVVKLSKILAEINYRFAVGADKKIILVAGLFDIFGALQ